MVILFMYHAFAAGAFEHFLLLPEELQYRCVAHLEAEELRQICHVSGHCWKLAERRQEELRNAARARLCAAPEHFDVVIESQSGMTSDELNAVLRAQVPGANVLLGPGEFPSICLEEPISIFGTLACDGQRLTVIQDALAETSVIVRPFATHESANYEYKLSSIVCRGSKNAFCVPRLDDCNDSTRYRSRIFLDRCLFESSGETVVRVESVTIQFNNCTVRSVGQDYGMLIWHAKVFLNACTISGSCTGVLLAGHASRAPCFAKFQDCTVDENQRGIDIIGAVAIVKRGVMRNVENVVFRGNSSGKVACKMGNHHVSFDYCEGAYRWLKYQGVPKTWYDAQIFLRVYAPICWGRVRQACRAVRFFISIMHKGPF